MIVVLGFLRGLFWIANYPVPFGDETAHFSFVRTVATGHGIPVTGRDFVGAEALRLYKENPTGGARATSIPPTPADERWGLAREQYEGYQAPLYPFVMAPVYWVGHIFGALGAFYALRVATLLLTLLGVPLVYWLAQECFPRRPAVWLLAPLCLVVLQIVSSHAALIDNDGVMVATGALALITLLRAREGLTTKRAVAFGGAVGLCALGKGSAAALAPALAIGIVGLVWLLRPPLRVLLRWLVIAGAAAAALVVPWILVNLAHYGELTGGKEAARVVAPVIGNGPVGLGGAWHYFKALIHTSFVAQDIDFLRTDTYRHVWSWAGVILGVGGVVMAAVRRHRDELEVAGWLVASIQLGLVALVFVAMSQSGAQTAIFGRHLFVLLPVWCVAVAYGAVALAGWRLGAIAIILIIVVAGWLEISSEQFWVSANYAGTGYIAGAAPAFENTYGTTTMNTRAVLVDVPCAVTAVALHLGGAPAATANGRPLAVGQSEPLWTPYLFDPPQKGPLVITFASDVTVDAGTARSPEVTFPGRADLAPVARVYCGKQDDPAGTRFAQLYRPHHPFPLSLRGLRSWPVGLAVLQTIVGLAVIAVLLRGMGVSGPAVRRS